MEVLIGVVFPEKQKAWTQPFQWEAKRYGKKRGMKIKVASVDFDRPIKEQGFDMIITKLSEHLAIAARNEQKKKEVRRPGKGQKLFFFFFLLLLLSWSANQPKQ